jgi:hypothetical protein
VPSPRIQTPKASSVRIPAYRYAEDGLKKERPDLGETGEDGEDRVYPPGYYPPRRRS